MYSDLAEATDPKLAVIGSHLFFNDTLGALLSLQWEKRHSYDAGKYHRLESRYDADELRASAARGALKKRFQ